VKNAYERPTSVELRTVTGPRPGVQAVLDAIVWKWSVRGVRSAGIYNRRTVRGRSGPLTPLNASLHSVGRGLDISVPTKQVGDELFLRLVAAADAIGICEIIWWDRRITSKGEKPYKGVDNHHTHLHVGFTADFADRKNDADLRKWVTHFVFGS
jgi:hypothetical protein